MVGLRTCKPKAEYKDLWLPFVYYPSRKLGYLEQLLDNELGSGMIVNAEYNAKVSDHSGKHGI